MPLRNAHDLWTKLQDKYGASNIVEDDCSPSTSGRDELSTSSTSPTCDVYLSGASSNDSSSCTTFFLMAKDSKVSSTLNPNISYDKSSDDDVDKEVDDESKKLVLWLEILEGETKEM